MHDTAALRRALANGKGTDLSALLLLEEGALLDPQQVRTLARDALEVDDPAERADYEASLGAMVLSAAAVHANVSLQGCACAGVRVERVRAHTPLAWACYAGDADTVCTLLRAGADPNEGDRDGCTPLFVAALFGHEACARMLLDAGAHPEQAARDGTTPLAAAVSARRGGVIPLLARAAGRKLV